MIIVHLASLDRLCASRCLLQEKKSKTYLVAVIGAGPAGLYAAQYLARQGIHVVLFNRDIKPGGLAEYGIYPDKYKMRTGLQAQFDRILAMPTVRYLGNVVVGQSGDIKLDQLRNAGFQAILVTTGAQKGNWLGIPGEDLAGVYHANDVVFNYTQMPGYSDKTINIHDPVAVIGVGNVMLDIVNFIKQKHLARSVTAYGRRGPTEVKFDKQTLESVAGCLDLETIRSAVDEVRSSVLEVGKNLDGFYSLLENARRNTGDCNSGLKFNLRFLRSPRRLIGNSSGQVSEVVFEINRLVLENGQVIPKGTGKLETVKASTLVFSIGSQVDAGFGLPVAQGNFITNPEPRFPVDGISYEAYNPDLCAHCEDIFVSGWARQASEGIVGLARKDAERGAKAVRQYLETLEPMNPEKMKKVFNQTLFSGIRVIERDDLLKLRSVEKKMAEKTGLMEFKFSTNEEMLKIIEGK